MPKEPIIEYRVCWSASSNISFRGEGEWHEANEGETAEEVEDSVGRPRALARHNLNSSAMPNHALNARIQHCFVTTHRTPWEDIDDEC